MGQETGNNERACHQDDMTAESSGQESFCYQRISKEAKHGHLLSKDKQRSKTWAQTQVWRESPKRDETSTRFDRENSNTQKGRCCKERGESVDGTRHVSGTSSRGAYTNWLPEDPVVSFDMKDDGRCTHCIVARRRELH